MKVLAVYDSKVEEFLPPFLARTVAEGIRNFQTATNTETHPFNEHPEDYTLFEVGEWDAQSGTFMNAQTPVSHGLAVHFKENGD